MTVVRRGFDTTVNSEFPTTPNGDANYLKVKTAVKRVLLQMPLPGIVGRTVLSATLTGHARGTWVSQTITATRVIASWSAATAHWDNQPADTGSGASVVTGALVDGDEFALDVTTMLQTVANGAAWYGFRIVTNSATEHALYAFDSGQPAWTLTYELSEDPEQPTMLVPDGAGIVSATKPKLSWDFIDFGGSTEQAAFRVQIDPSGAAGGTPNFDTGTVLSTEPMFDSTTSMPRTVTMNRTNASPTITAAAGTFEDSDIGMGITGTGIPGSTTIIAVAGGGASATMSANATSSGSGMTGTITRIYPGFSTAGGTTQWRVMVRDAANLWSTWSDWAIWTYRAKPTLIMDSPTGTTLTDPSPVIQAHPSTGTLSSYRIRVANGGDRTRIRYDTHKIATTAATITHTIPFRNEDGTRIFVDQTNYWLNVRAEDTYDRIGTAGAAVYMETWVLVTFVDAGGVGAPVLTSVTQPTGLPQMRLVWTRGTSPDGWVVLRNNQPYARLLPTDVTNVSGTYTWNDPDYVPAFRDHSWKVKAVSANAQGVASNTITFKATLTGVWLVSELGGVKIRTNEVSNWTQLDRTAVYKPLRRGIDVAITDAQEGLSGSVSGPLRDEVGLTRETALDRLEAMKDAITTPVWLLAGDMAIRVRLYDLTYSGPDDDTMATQLRSNVSFRFTQSSGITYGV